MEKRKHNNCENISNLTNVQVTESNFNASTCEYNNITHKGNHILFIEAFYGGSHKQLLNFLTNHVPYTLVTLSAKKWPWRARCSALILADEIPQITNEKILFSSSVLSLAELLGLRPDLNALKKIVYFHENQFIYPIREIKARDVQFAYNQITTCLAADLILFNSKFNMDTLLNNLSKIIKLFPDYKPKHLKERIADKCSVVYFPVHFPSPIKSAKNDLLTIVWPHRWEFDKNPEMFFEILLELKRKGHQFYVHILGETFHDVPDIFSIAKEELNKEILTFGYLANKEEYYNVLSSSHVALSTARHEFFGVSMLEATFCGCFPLVPNDLVYPEIYPQECLYKDQKDCIEKLEKLCGNLSVVERLKNEMKMDFEKYSADCLLDKYLNVFNC